MIRSLFFTQEGELLTDLPVEQWPAFLQKPAGLLWVDFEATPAEEDEPILRQVFNFHPLAIDDALQETHVAKIDDWDDYLYIVLEAVFANGNLIQDGLEIVELDVFLGHQYMVTHHDLPIQAVENVWLAVQRDQRFLKRGADGLLYRLVDEVIAAYAPVFDKLDDAIDHNEDELFNRPTTHTLEHIFAIKRATLHLRRIIAPQREVLNRLARDDFAVIDARGRIYFRDVYDHLVRQYEIVESLRDLVSGSLDTYLSVINNRMNDIMKTLTMITTMFMPISFIASFFGMNFFGPVASLERWTATPAFIITLSVTVLLPFIMYRWMRHRGWF